MTSCLNHLQTHKTWRGRYRSEWGHPSDARIIVNLGMFSQLKGQEVLVRSFGSLAKEFPNAYLVIVGSAREFEPGIREMLEAIALQLGISDRLVFAGSRDDVLKLLYNFEIYVMPSRVEGFGLSLVETMCTGIPAIVSDIEAFEEITEHGTYALLFKSGSWEDLTEKLRYALTHRDKSP